MDHVTTVLPLDLAPVLESGLDVGKECTVLRLWKAVGFGETYRDAFAHCRVDGPNRVRNDENKLVVCRVR